MLALAPAIWIVYRLCTYKNKRNTIDKHQTWNKIDALIKDKCSKEVYQTFLREKDQLICLELKNPNKLNLCKKGGCLIYG